MVDREQDADRGQDRGAPNRQIATFWPGLERAGACDLGRGSGRPLVFSVRKECSDSKNHSALLLDL